MISRIATIFMVICALALRAASAGADSPYFCAGVSANQAQRDSRLTVSSQTNSVYVGGIGVTRKYDINTFSFKDQIEYPKTARFQVYDSLRDWIWLMTAQGAASLDLEERAGSPVMSTLSVDGQNCPFDSTFINELDGVAYYTCSNGTSFAYVLKVAMTDRKAAVVASLPLVELALEERLRVVSMSPDRHHSFMYLLHTDSTGKAVAIYVIRSNSGASGLALAAAYSGPDVGNIILWSGVDNNFIYTLEGTNQKEAMLTRRDLISLRVVAQSKQSFLIPNLIASSLDASTNQVVIWSQENIYLFASNGDLNNPMFSCSKMPNNMNCSNWKLTGNTAISGSNFFAVGSCQTSAGSVDLLTRVLLNTNDGCPSHCSGHGSCFNSTCICAKGYSGSDCSKGGSSNGCGKTCVQDSDCWVNPPWNPCPVCHKGVCQTVCTTPCETSAQCRSWGSHSVMNPCVSCNKTYKYCGTDTNGCGAQCSGDGNCLDQECPRCTVQGVWPVGKCVH